MKCIWKRLEVLDYLRREEYSKLKNDCQKSHRFGGCGGSYCDCGCTRKHPNCNYNSDDENIALNILLKQHKES